MFGLDVMGVLIIIDNLVFGCLRWCYFVFLVMFVCLRYVFSFSLYLVTSVVDVVLLFLVVDFAVLLHFMFTDLFHLFYACLLFMFWFLFVVYFVWFAFGWLVGIYVDSFVFMLFTFALKFCCFEVLAATYWLCFGCCLTVYCLCLWFVLIVVIGTWLLCVLVVLLI